jgi:hypothetical protein
MKNENQRSIMTNFSRSPGYWVSRFYCNLVINIYTYSIFCTVTQHKSFQLYICTSMYCIVRLRSYILKNFNRALPLTIFDYFTVLNSFVIANYSMVEPNKCLKGQCHEIFDPRFFIKQYALGPWFTFLNSASNSPRYDRFSKKISWHGPFNCF